MGVKGAAIATLISQLFNMAFILICFVICIRKDGDTPMLSLHFRKSFYQGLSYNDHAYFGQRISVEPWTEC